MFFSVPRDHNNINIHYNIFSDSSDVGESIERSMTRSDSTGSYGSIADDENDWEEESSGGTFMKKLAKFRAEVHYRLIIVLY
jgi:hypothetical protein